MTTRVRSAVILLALCSLLALGAPSASAAPPGSLASPPPAFTSRPLVATGSDTRAKGPSSRLARSDAKLLARTDRNRISVLVKLDYDAIASYTGTVRGLAPTSPSATHRPLTRNTTLTSAYSRYIAR